MRVPPRTTPRLPSPSLPDFSEEQALLSQGYSIIAGIDEAGRGSWAGPLVAAAVRLPATGDLFDRLNGVRDSKQLSARGRELLYPRILECALDVGIGVVSPFTIDQIGLARSGQLAMLWSVEELSTPPDCLLIDAFTIKDCRLPQRPIIRGDQISLSIAAASIVAKVSRDRLMQSADRVYPGYGFGMHKGYGTGLHQKALQEIGPCGYHRYSYQPLRTQGRLLP